MFLIHSINRYSNTNIDTSLRYPLVIKEVLRTEYIEKILYFKDRTEILKVIIGPRGSGKSVLLEQYRRRLIETGVEEKSVLCIDLRSPEFHDVKDHKDLNDYLSTMMPREQRAYVFIEGIQRISEWERTINSLSVDYDADVYITGSNGYLMSSELSTYLSGRYLEIEVLPLSFKEFLRSNPADADNDRNSRFQKYLKLGGIPLVDPNADMRTNDRILEGTYHMILLKEVAQRANIKDTIAFEAVAKFIFENTQNLTNVESITSELEINTKTVKKYISALEEAFLIFKAERYDIVGKKIQHTHVKYYPADPGLARVAISAESMEPSAVLETVVYLELRRRGYRIYVGSYRDKEVDFIAEKGGRINYYQVCQTLLPDDIFGKKVDSLDSIRDSYPKTILSLDSFLRPAPNGIEHRNVINWLLE